MFIITTPDGPVDVDNEAGRQDRYNKFMSAILKEKESMFQLEIDFIVLNREFETLKQIKPWLQIALNSGAFVVAVLCEGKVIEIKINENL